MRVYRDKVCRISQILYLCTDSSVICNIYWPSRRSSYITRYHHMDFAVSPSVFQRSVLSRSGPIPRMEIAINHKERVDGGTV